MINTNIVLITTDSQSTVSKILLGASRPSRTAGGPPRPRAPTLPPDRLRFAPGDLAGISSLRARPRGGLSSLNEDPLAGVLRVHPFPATTNYTIHHKHTLHHTRSLA
jgi:hypothetical protein